MRILIADDHNLVAEAIGSIICNDPIFSEFVTAETLSRANRILEHDTEIGLALIDVHMPGMSGLSELKAWRLAWPELPIILMSGYAGPRILEEAKRIGIAGFFPKTAAPADILLLLKEAVRASCSSGFLDIRAYRPDGLLSSREIEIAAHIGGGLSNKEIARLLGISPETVKAHIKSTAIKLDARNRAEIAIRAMKEGYF